MKVMTNEPELQKGEEQSCEPHQEKRACVICRLQKSGRSDNKLFSFWVQSAVI